MNNDPQMHSLLEDLKSPNEGVRQHAAHELWRLWFEQKGKAGLDQIRKSETFLQAGQPDEAEAVLNQLIGDLPDFTEAWNRRAVLYYVTRRYRKALEDCKVVLTLNPKHFGALHGMGLCYLALEEYPAALRAFHQALEVQPYSVENQRLILECNARL
ncbi:MAG: tetratricopeptide repeat protein [Microcoleaceae cyanobacterium]